MLVKIWHRFFATESTTNDYSVISHESNTSSDFNYSFDEQQAVMQYLNQTNASLQSIPGNNAIETTIELFQPEQMSSNCSVLQYWESMKNSEPKLYKLATVVFSVPPTEVQIERDFSNLKCVFTDRRSNLEQQRLEDIMLIHLNKYLFYKINEQQLTEMKSMRSI